MAKFHELPEDLRNQITAEIDTVKTMDHDTLVERFNGYANKYGDTAVDSSARDSWLKTKLKSYIQRDLMEAAGHKEDPVMSENREAKGPNEKAPKQEKKPGRPKLKVAGRFSLALGADGGGAGRVGSTRNGIITTLQARNSDFTFEDFLEATKSTMGWDGQNFTKPTKFKTIEQATNAWFSELKNKAKVIVCTTEPVFETAEEVKATAAEVSA